MLQLIQIWFILSTQIPWVPPVLGNPLTTQISNPGEATDQDNSHGIAHESAAKDSIGFAFLLGGALLDCLVSDSDPLFSIRMGLGGHWKRLLALLHVTFTPTRGQDQGAYFASLAIDYRPWNHRWSPYVGGALGASWNSFWSSKYRQNFVDQRGGPEGRISLGLDLFRYVVFHVRWEVGINAPFYKSKGGVAPGGDFSREYAVWEYMPYAYTAIDWVVY